MCGHCELHIPHLHGFKSKLLLLLLLLHGFRPKLLLLLLVLAIPVFQTFFYKACQEVSPVAHNKGASGWEEGEW